MYASYVKIITLHYLVPGIWEQVRYVVFTPLDEPILVQVVQRELLYWLYMYMYVRTVKWFRRLFCCTCSVTRWKTLCRILVVYLVRTCYSYTYLIERALLQVLVRVQVVTFDTHKYRLVGGYSTLRTPWSRRGLTNRGCTRYQVRVLEPTILISLLPSR